VKEIPLSFNRYLYGNNNPYTFYDPLLKLNENINMIELLSSILSPWILRTTMGVDDFIREAVDTHGSSIQKGLLILDGRKMHDYDEVYDEFSRVMSFPDYFGRNLNALDECLSDLEWLGLDSYIIFIKNADEVLQSEAEGGFDGLIEILVNAAKEFSMPVNMGEAWDRGAVLFHVILQSNKNSLKLDFVNGY